jgi:hypothetical protein
MNDAYDLRQEWQPPPRPEWVRRINEEGDCMDIAGVVPLDEQSLLDAAMRATGLSDFGSDDWREPFQVLVKSMEEDAELNLMGRLMTRSEILQLLCARLQIEDWYKRHPEIDDEEIIAPIFVVGQGRSGTSFLVNVLGANPDNGAMPQWQATFPCPPPEQEHLDDDPRIERADKLIRQWVRVCPTLESMHEFGGRIPLECMQILALSFRSSSWFVALGQAASYEAYIARQDMTPALEYHKRVLKLLQWKNPRKHWVLKDPMHLYRMPFMLKFYPDARFVWPHRDPVRALASIVSMIGTIQWGRSDHPFKGGSFEYLLDPNLSAGGFNMVIDQIEAGQIPPGQLYSLRYTDLVANTLPTLEAMYRHLGLDLSEAGHRGMADYLAANPRTARPPHQLNTGSEATVARARAAFKRYQDYFGIPNE